MAGEPAIVKVMNALLAQMATIAGVNVFTDRTNEEGVMPDERPAMCVNIAGGSIDVFDGGGQVGHSLNITVYLFEGSLTSQTISIGLATMLSQLNAALELDRTLGGLVGDINIREYSVNEESVPDLGCMIVEVSVIVSTLSGNFNTVMGATGAFP